MTEAATVHQSEWERLTTDEKLEHVRLHQVAQDRPVHHQAAGPEEAESVGQRDRQEAGEARQVSRLLVARSAS